MCTNWTLETIQFLPGNDADDPDKAFNFSIPFLDLQMPDLRQTGPKENEDNRFFIHRCPRILALGMLLFQICCSSPFQANISRGFSAMAVNTDCAKFCNANKPGQGWPNLDLDKSSVRAYSNIVSECFPLNNGSDFEGTLLDPSLDVAKRRALLRKKVVVPLHGLLKGMELFDEDETIKSAVGQPESNTGSKRRVHVSYDLVYDWFSLTNFV
jgi:hypothetical protein